MTPHERAEDLALHAPSPFPPLARTSPPRRYGFDKEADFKADVPTNVVFYDLGMTSYKVSVVSFTAVVGKKNKTQGSMLARRPTLFHVPPHDLRGGCRHLTYPVCTCAGVAGARARMGLNTRRPRL